MGGKRRVAAEVGRFSIVGAVATTVAIVLFNVLLHGFGVIDPLLADRPLTSYVIANAIGMLVSYSGTKSWVFRDRRTNYADGGFVAYTVINVATMALPVACLWLSREVLGLTDPVSDNVSANVIGLAMGFTARFYLFRRFVFRRHDITPSVRAVAPLNGSTGRSSGDPARRADRASAAD